MSCTTSPDHTAQLVENWLERGAGVSCCFTLKIGNACARRWWGADYARCGSSSILKGRRWCCRDLLVPDFNSLYVVEVRVPKLQGHSSLSLCGVWISNWGWTI